jgi:hypothetical protein
VTPKSGFLLAMSCVTAIASVGSIFELSSGVPELGVKLTTFILVVSIPLSAFCFFAAVQDARSNQQ